MQTNIKNKDFIYELIHDIKAPILSIDYALKNIQKNELLDEIYKINKQNLNYIEELLLNYSVSKGIYTLNFENVDIIQIINEEIKTLNPIIKTRRLNFKFNNSEILFFKSDKYILRQIILNVLTNAVKYSKENSVIETEILKKEKSIHICFKNCIEEEKSNFTSNKMGLEIINKKIKLLNGKIKKTMLKNRFCFEIEFKYY